MYVQRTRGRWRSCHVAESSAYTTLASAFVRGLSVRGSNTRAVRLPLRVSLAGEESGVSQSDTGEAMGQCVTTYNSRCVQVSRFMSCAIQPSQGVVGRMTSGKWLRLLLAVLGQIGKIRSHLAYLK